MKKIFVLFFALLPSALWSQIDEIKKIIDKIGPKIQEVNLGPDWYRVHDIEDAFISLPGDTVGVNFKKTADSTCVKFFCTGGTAKLVTCVKTSTSLTIYAETLSQQGLQISELELRNLLAQFQKYLDGLKRPKKTRKGLADPSEGYTLCPSLFLF